MFSPHGAEHRGFTDGSHCADAEPELMRSRPCMSKPAGYGRPHAEKQNGGIAASVFSIR